MSSIRNTVSKSLMVLGLVVGLLAVFGTVGGQGCPDAAGCEALSEGTSKMGLAIGAGLAVGLAGLATGLAQKDIGAAAVGAVAEDASFLGRAILFIAIPETIVIFGVLIAFQLVGKIG